MFPRFASEQLAALRLVDAASRTRLDRVAAGTLCERLFSRLNTIHRHTGAAPAEVTIT